MLEETQGEHMIADSAFDADSALTNTEPLRTYYQQEGYVVLRHLTSPDLCDQIRSAFEQEVKPYQKPLYRWSTYPERHVFDARGHMLNALIDVHSLNASYFSRFKTTVLSVLTHPNLYKTVCALVGEEAMLVQTMYFESNQATPAHQDTYYMDSSVLGRMVGVWVAVEDIHPDAEQFYISPGSHKLDAPKNSGAFDVAFHHAQYKASVEDMIEKHKLERRAPVMQKGDVIFWTAKTIHGSLAARDSSRSRSSITGHFIPTSTGLVHLQKLEKKLEVHRVNGVLVHFPKDQSKLMNRLRYSAELHFPRIFPFLKRIVIKAVLK
jgi:phytanoyl-CoA hydroxylase